MKYKVLNMKNKLWKTMSVNDQRYMACKVKSMKYKVFNMKHEMWKTMSVKDQRFIECKVKSMGN